MWHSINFLLAIITVEENFTIDTTFIFKFYFSMLHSLIKYPLLHLLAIVFEFYFHIFSETGGIHLIFIKLTKMNEKFKAVDVKFKMQVRLSGKEATTAINFLF